MPPFIPVALEHRTNISSKSHTFIRLTLNAVLGSGEKCLTFMVTKFI